MRHHHLSEYLNILPEHTDSSLSVTTFHVSTLIHHCDIITTFITVDMYIFIVMAFLWTPLIKNQILRYVVYKPHLLLLLLHMWDQLRDLKIIFIGLKGLETG